MPANMVTVFKAIYITMCHEKNVGAKCRNRIRHGHKPAFRHAKDALRTHARHHCKLNMWPFEGAKATYWGAKEGFWNPKKAQTIAPKAIKHGKRELHTLPAKKDNARKTRPYGCTRNFGVFTTKKQTTCAESTVNVKAQCTMKARHAGSVAFCQTKNRHKLPGGGELYEYSWKIIAQKLSNE